MTDDPNTYDPYGSMILNETFQPTNRVVYVGDVTLINADYRNVLQLIDTHVDQLVVDFPAAHESMSQADVEAWIADFTAWSLEITRPNSAMILIPRERRTVPYSKSAISCREATRQGWELFREFIWHKRNADFDRAEPAFGNVYALRRGGISSRKESEVRYLDIVRITSSKKKYDDAIDEIPVGVFTHFLTLFGAPGSTVLDPFTGSGTSAIGALKVGLKPIAVEIHPGRFDAMVERITAFVETGNDPGPITYREG